MRSRFPLLMAGLTAVALTAACLPTPPTTPSTPPQARPAGLAKPAKPAAPSAASRALRTYYAQLQADLLAQGLMRQDGGGPDTPYGAREVARNFERIAFYDEYARGGGLRSSEGAAPGGLRRWSGPVRMRVEFGASVSAEERASDTAEVAGYVTRLASLTTHPISLVTRGGNFHVLFMSEDDRPQAISRIKQLVPNISQSSLDIFRDLPREIHCLVLAFSGDDSEYDYRRAIALVRTEHPPLMRRACVHEELAQGLGLANDSLSARPSIFNDDDEFALLTSHDELLLRMLYDPRLSIGETAEDARPMVQQMAKELTGEVEG